MKIHLQLLAVAAFAFPPCLAQSGHVRTAAVPAPRWSAITADPGIAMDTIRVRSGTDVITTYVARPRRAGRLPAVIVLHANRVTEPYIASTTQMLARAGFVAMAVDVFHFLPGNESWEAAQIPPRDSVSASVAREFREPRLVRNVQSGIDYLRRQPFVASGGVGMVGFCGGGWNSLLVAAQSADVGAVVAFYAPTTLSDTQHRAAMMLASYIRVPVQYHRATKDQFVPAADVDRFVATLRTQGTMVERYDYDAEHGFFAWNRGTIFSESDANAAWNRLVPFLRAHTGKPLVARALAPAAAEEGAASATKQHALLH